MSEMPERWEPPPEPMKPVPSNRPPTAVLVFVVLALLFAITTAAVGAALSISSMRRDGATDAELAEADPHLTAIAFAQQRVHARTGRYLELPWCPATLPGSTPVPWPACDGWSDLEWAPKGSVLCRYRVAAMNEPPRPDWRSFEVLAECDGAGDGTPVVRGKRGSAHGQAPAVERPALDPALQDELAPEG